MDEAKRLQLRRKVTDSVSAFGTVTGIASPSSARYRGQRVGD